MKHLLLLEDGETDTRIYLRKLKEEYDTWIKVEVCPNINHAKAFLASASTEEVGVAIIDGSVPEDEGGPTTSTVPFVKWVRGKYPDLILIAAAGDKGRNDELDKAGCHLVLQKKARSHNFRATISFAFTIAVAKKS